MTAVELMIRWNNYSSTNRVDTAAQILPLLVSLGSLARIMLMARPGIERRDRKGGTQRQTNANEHGSGTHADRPSQEHWTRSEPGIRDTVSIQESDASWFDAMSHLETSSTQDGVQSPQIPRVAFMSGSLFPSAGRAPDRRG
ncbi:hypothetical protein CDD82_7825 [Ophiocordyceps australis]|uniref:Uncharacterized protein n=1 Tax=Ophiocordyceps australis TaxID=1399860 RepID=A0A2C5YQZ9_9HYPO|nr:hypothetical protein CDD82_7825 [Ophiocordyceps australis]